MKRSKEGENGFATSKITALYLAYQLALDMMVLASKSA